MTAIKVLLVDDDPDIRKIAQLALGSTGNFEVVLAASGPEAMKSVLDCNPDLVVLDSRMPAMDGMVAYEKIRDRAPSVPIVIAATRINDRDRRQFEQMGVKAIIEKPFNPTTLSQQLKNLLKS
ncbi:MAG: response regulator [Candidatus Obscuribacterales bacterium]|nr:response regulator [Candidatus Obscuribacterales bacterium]